MSADTEIIPCSFVPDKSAQISSVLPPFVTDVVWRTRLGVYERDAYRASLTGKIFIRTSDCILRAELRSYDCGELSFHHLLTSCTIFLFYSFSRHDVDFGW